MTGRRERIRTSGPYVPNVVLYQAELLSDAGRRIWPVSRERPYSHAPWPPQPTKINEIPGYLGAAFGIFAALKAFHPLYMVPRLTTDWGVAKW
jgi:hypothetical protein